MPATQVGQHHKVRKYFSIRNTLGVLQSQCFPKNLWHRTGQGGVARKTFIGNLYKQVKDPNLIASMSGHSEGSRAFARFRKIDDETYFNTKQVRELFNVCDATLNTWAKRGYLVPVKFGNKNMYTKTDIDRIRTSNRTETVSAFCRKKKLQP